jgi:hypothetical protein
MQKIVPQIPSPTVDADLACRRCGYNLRTLSADKVCPECGLAIRASIAAANAARSRAGEPLRQSDRRWVASLRNGLLILFVAYALQLLFAVPSFDLALDRLSSNSSARLLLMWFEAWGLPLLFLYGAWRFGRLESRRLHHNEATEAMAWRASAGVYAIALLLRPTALHAQFSGPTSWVFLHPVQWLAAAIATWFFLARLTRIARRLPSRALALQGNIMKWSMAGMLALQAIPVFFAGGYALVILEQWNPVPGIGELIMQRGDRSYIMVIGNALVSAVPVVIIYRLLSACCLVLALCVLAQLFRVTRRARNAAPHG